VATAEAGDHDAEIFRKGWKAGERSAFTDWDAELRRRVEALDFAAAYAIANLDASVEMKDLKPGEKADQRFIANVRAVLLRALSGRDGGGK
jgi:hypothetical protein